MAGRLAPVPAVRTRNVTVRCVACGCREESVMRAGPVEPTERVWALLEGMTPLLRFGGCAVACRCHEEEPHQRPGLSVTAHRPGETWAGGGER